MKINSNLETLQLNEAPPTEITRDQILDVIANIATRRALDLPSYGGYVVRNDPELPFIDTQAFSTRIIEVIGRPYTHDWSSILLKSVKGGSHGIHADGGATNDITMHVTYSGVAEFALFVGSRVDVTGFDKDLPPWSTDGLFFRSHPLTVPSKVIRGRLGPGDALIFDHTECHDFSSVTPERESVAYFARRFEKN